MCMPGKWCLEKFDMCFTFLIMKPFPFALIYVNVSYPSSYHNQTFPHSTLSDTIQHRYTYSRHVRSAKRCGPRDTYSASSPITNLKLESAPGNYADGRNPAPVDAEVCSLSHYLQGFTHPRWCRSSSINSMSMDLGNLSSFIEGITLLAHKNVFKSLCLVLLMQKRWSSPTNNGARCSGTNKKKVASNTSGLFIEWGFFLKDVFQMFTFPPSYLNFLGNCEFPRNEDANQIKMILRHFLGANHKNYPNVKTLHLAILFGMVFLASNPIHPSPSAHHHLPIISKALPRCIDTNTIYGEAAFGHAFIFDRWTDTYRSACTCPIWSTSKRFGPNAPLPWLFGKCHVNILSGAE